jgi:hypothetical protein
MNASDRKIFAPMLRGDAQSTETQICAVLGRFQAGATCTGLVGELFRLGLVVGVGASVTERIGDLLHELEGTARVERIPDGRYRVVKSRG